MIGIILSISLWISGIYELPAVSASVEWLDETEFDFGAIARAQAVEHTFRFKNKSDRPLIIETVRTTCGCTGSTWDESPILPDSIGMINIEYDAKQSGNFRKYARIYFEGVHGAEKLWIKGFVVEDEE